MTATPIFNIQVKEDHRKSLPSLERYTFKVLGMSRENPDHFKIPISDDNWYLVKKDWFDIERIKKS